jgi:acyl-CoA synthetase (AMP-forming)/AMP-acid ligase II
LIAQDLQPQALIQSIAEEKATGGWISVPIWSDIINMIKAGSIKIDEYDFSNLRYIAMGAQPVPSILLEDSKKVFPGLKMINTYGITEGGGGCTITLYDEDVLRKSGAIGQPGPFMEAKIVDDKGETLPPGKVGELLLKGPRLMKEYAYNPEMTARTITDGWLHTGDLAYTDEDGFFFFADRSKDLIIRGGENIFPAEIENILRKHPKIQDVAAIGYPHPRLVEITMVIIQLKPGEIMKEEEVIEFCKEEGLAKYKWPEKIVYANVPRNPAGKIEKPKLREIYVKPAKEAMEKE